MKLGKKKIKGFATVSGIGTTTSDIIKLWSKKIPSLGLITTKSVGLDPKKGNSEPIICQLDEKTFRNAVGLTNPGCHKFAEELKEIYPLPDDKFLLTSIFGKTADELRQVAEIVAPYTDGLELNFSCPHAEKGYGSTIGSSKDLTYKFTKAVKDAVDLPVVVKLTPNVNNIGEIAKAAENAGADAIAAINTYNPDETIEQYTGKPILSNNKGGMSGKGVKDIGLKCVKEISDAVSIPIIGMGGISSAKDVQDYIDAGASIVGIGSALAGMDTQTVIKYFEYLDLDMKNGSDNAKKLTLDKMIMKYKPFKIKKIEKVSSDLRIFHFDKGLKAKPGQFIFTWIPGSHEKPFSIAYDNPLVLAIRKIGHHTSSIFNLKENDELMIRGPYGNSLPLKKDDKVLLVAGGTGAAPAYFLAKQVDNPIIFIGGKTKDQILFKDELEKIGTLVTATEDGSLGFQGFVTDALEDYIKNNNVKDAYFFNCGPELMMEKSFDIEKKYTDLSRIFCSIERMCSCGTGLCGKCSFDGLRSCVDGAIFDGIHLDKSSDFGNYRRNKTGEKVKI